MRKMKNKIQITTIVAMILGALLLLVAMIMFIAGLERPFHWPSISFLYHLTLWSVIRTVFSLVSIVLVVVSILKNTKKFYLISIVFLVLTIAIELPYFIQTDYLPTMAMQISLKILWIMGLLALVATLVLQIINNQKNKSTVVLPQEEVK